jgi:hypothetical protein
MSRGAGVLRHSFLLTAALPLCSCVFPTAPIDWRRWRPSFPDHYDVALESKVRRIERHLLERHLSPEGLLVYRRSPAAEEAAEGYPNLADMAIWSGCAAAALAFKYGVTRDRNDRALLLRVLGGLRLLQRVTGVPGLLARAVAPASGVIAREHCGQEWRPGAEGHAAYRYRGDVSKDQYFGVLFGYAVAAMVAGGDEEVRDAMEDEVGAIAEHLWSNHLRIVDADGRTTTFGDVRGYIWGIPIGPNAALCLLSQRLAWQVSGDTRFGTRYGELLERGYAFATGFNKFQVLAITNHNNDVMAMMALYSLVSLEEDASVREHYQRSLRHLWRWVENEANLFFHCVYHAAGGRTLPPRARRDIRHTFHLYPVDLHLVPVDLREHELVERSCLPGRGGEIRNRTALPLHLRKLSSFAWKSSPYELVGNEGARGEKTVAGVGLYLAYWMARFHGLPGLPRQETQAAATPRDAVEAPNAGPETGPGS